MGQDAEEKGHNLINEKLLEMSLEVAVKQPALQHPKGQSLTALSH